MPQPENHKCRMWSGFSSEIETSVKIHIDSLVNMSHVERCQ